MQFTPYGVQPDQSDFGNPIEGQMQGNSNGKDYLTSAPKIQPMRRRMDLNNKQLRDAYIDEMQARTDATNEGIRRSQLGSGIVPKKSNPNVDDDEANDGTNVNRLDRFAASQNQGGPNQAMQGNQDDSLSRYVNNNPSSPGITDNSGGTPSITGNVASITDPSALAAPLNVPSPDGLSSLAANPTGAPSTPPPSGVPPIIPMTPPNTSRLDAFNASQKPAATPTSSQPTAPGAAPLIPAGAPPSSTAVTGGTPPSASGPDQPVGTPGPVHSWDPNSPSNMLRSQRFNALNSTIANATGGNPSPSPTPSSSLAGGDDDEAPTTPKIQPRKLNQSAVSGAGMAFA